MFSAPRLAKCDWQDSELHVEVGVWPEVVTVWVGGRAMPYVPVTTDLAEEVMSKAKACDENAKLRELVDELWALAYGYVYDESELDKARELMRELGMEAD